MVLELILPILVDLIADPIKQYVVAPIRRHVGYAFKCDSKVHTLHDEVMKLKNKKDRLQQSVDDATRNGEEIYENVSNWLNSVKTDIEEAEKLIQEKESAKKKCLVGFCPNLRTRYQLSKKAEKKASVIEKQLQNAQGLDPIAFRPPLQQIVEPSVYSREALPSRVLILNQIMDALKDPNLNMIGVYGMGGIGKTTLAKEVQLKAMQDKLFETVVMVDVSQMPELRRIQSVIADFLGLKFEAQEVAGRASQLSKRLKKSKVLIILDDVWQELDLNTVGIPFGDSCEGCKILLTSRRKYVLSSGMGTQKEFSLNVLEEEESWSLFQTIVANSRDPKLQATAIEIAKKCAGLPLLIVIVAKELQNKESSAWDDMLMQLSVVGNDDLHQKVHKVLESSFENLSGEEDKSLFLLCALFPQSNIQIQYLLIYSMGLGLFKHRVTIEQARKRLFTLINKLKAECLLLDGDMDGFVKMHDLVRDVAVSIASRLQHAFIGGDEVRLKDWPSKHCTRISLPYSDVHGLPIGLEYQEVDSFLLFTEDISLEIPDLFFEGITKVKVVDFTGMRLVSLPSSLASLTHLNALCLHTCRLDNVTIICELKQLELLSFVGSKIVELPKEVEALTQLKLLDLTNCSQLEVIPANVLSKLYLLEELYMINSFVGWDVKGNVSLVELENLSHLSTLEIQIENPKLIPKGCRFFDGLQSYKISIGDEWDWGGKHETSRTLKLKLEAGVHLEDGIKQLLKGTEELYLDELGGIQSVLYDLDREGFPKLKHLHIQNDDSIQRLIKSTMWASSCVFPILESLYLDNLYSLENICDGQLESGSFGKLQTLNIRRCNKLENIFSFSAAKCLTQLQEMVVSECDNIEAIVGERGENENDNEVIEFPHLDSLVLCNLPYLRGIYSRKEGTGEMALTADLSEAPLQLFNEMVSFPNLTNVLVEACSRLKYVFTASTVKCLKQLKHLKIRHCWLMEEIIESKKFDEIEDENVDKIVFLELDSLRLESLRNLKNFSCGYPIEFRSLRELSIRDCSAMNNFVSKFSANQCNEYFFNDMVTFSNLEIMNVIEHYNLRYLWHEELGVDSFCKLKSLLIHSCKELQVVFPSNALTRLYRVESIDLKSCDKVSEIYQFQEFDTQGRNNVEAFSLRDIRISNLPLLKHIWSTGVCEAFTFKNLQSVYVCECEDLKYVFPASIACDLFQLQKLEIDNCNVQVIANAKDEEFTGIPAFKFSQLASLGLKNLKDLRSLYEGPHTSEWPTLKSLEVNGCDREFLKFLFKIPTYHQQNTKMKQNIPVQHSEFCGEKFFSNLEQLILDHQGLMAIHTTEFPAELFFKVKKVTIKSLKEELIPFLFGFLRQLYSLEMIVFKSGSLEEIFLSDDHLRVKHLVVDKVDDLKHILKKDSQLDPILQYIYTLRVTNCDELMNIAPSLASFQNLTTLDVKWCRSMKNLVTTSTAKTMVRLVELRVSNCWMMKEIIASDEDCTDMEHDVMNFNKLKCLVLDGLSELNSFCSEIYTFSFPLLEQVVINGCFRMDSFCSGALSTPKLRGILLDGDKLWEGNLNTTIACQVRKQVDACFEEGKLVENGGWLDVVRDEFTSKAISANQLQLLNKCTHITVRDSESVQVIFDLEGVSAKDGYVGLQQLNKLHLVNLSMLNRLCNKAPKGILDFNKLKFLYIENCSRLKYAFDWATASCLFHLEEILVKNCEMMETIIKEEESEDGGEVTFGSRLAALKIECCRRLKYAFTWSMASCLFRLKEIQLKNCETMETIIKEKEKEKEAEDGGKGKFGSRLKLLKIESCNKLKYVFSCSIASCLVQLQSLEAKNCEMMETIIKELEGEDAAQVILCSLFAVVVESLPKFSCFYSGRGDLDCPSLKSINIRECPSIKAFISTLPKEDNIHFSHKVGGHMEEGRPFVNVDKVEVVKDALFSKAILVDQLHLLNSLTTISVRDCDAVQVVFDLDGICAKEGRVELLPKLSGLHLINLPVLSQLCNKAPRGILDFNKLIMLEIENCSRLVYAFTLSMASCLVQLQKIELRNCEMLETLIKEEEAADEAKVIFGSLKNVALQNLPKFTCFYSGKGDLECPLLEGIRIRDCPSIKAFIETLPREHEGGRGHNLGQVEYNFNFSHKVIPNLKELTLDHQGLIAISQSVEFFSVPKKIILSSLKEESVPLLCSFLRQSYSLETLVFEHSSLEEIFLLDDERAVREESHHLRLNHLKLHSVSDLRHILKGDSQLNPILQHLQTLDVSWCHDLLNIMPSTASFQNLTTLIISFCREMTYLVTASTAKTMAQLVHMKIEFCEMTKEIVANNGDCTEHDEIIFHKLKVLELMGLDMLNSFCLGNYTFNFPLLEQVTIRGCSTLKIFCGGVSITPKLRGIHFEGEQQWEGNLNATMACQIKKWVGGHFEEGRLFQNIESMEVVEDAISSKAILANQLQFLNKLRKLTVRDCNSVQVVFDLDELPTEGGQHVELLPQLNELELANLPMLSQLCNKAPRGILSFKKLKILKIENCSRLLYVFTWSMASCLFQLVEIQVKNCEKMETLIKEKESKNATKLIFGLLESVVMESLPNFSSFYSGRGDLKCPSLKLISITGCPSMKAFISTLPVEDKDDIQFGHQFIPNLEELALDHGSLMAMQSTEISDGIFSKLKKVTMFSFLEESIPFLFGFLVQLHSLEMLVFDCGYLEERLLCEDENAVGKEEHRPRLKHVELSYVRNLKHLLQKNSKLNPILQHLHTIIVRNCDDLINIAPSSASFQNLTTLNVECCKEMTSLVTASAAKTMVQLVELSVTNCEMTKEIIASDKGCREHDEIIFHKLRVLEFIGLDMLSSFCSGNYNFRFPLLENVTVMRCAKMKKFCGGVSRTPKLRGIEFEGKHQWEGNLNATIACQTKEWVGGHFEEGRLFQNVESIEMVEDAFSSKAILADQMQFLNNLRKITARDCDSIQVVFDLEGLSVEGGHVGLLRQLSELELISLPMLSQLCNKAPGDILDLNKLKVLKIENCSKLVYAFTWSMASCLVHIQEIEVKNCKMMETLIKEEEVEDATQLVFGSLESIGVEGLPKLSSFYSGRSDLECPSLKAIAIIDCPIIKAFVSRSPSDNEEQGNFRFNHKVFPYLETLVLDIKSIRAILQFELPIDFFAKVKYLGLGNSSATTKSHVPLLQFCSTLPYLDELHIWCSSFKELFNFEGLSTNLDEATTLPQIRVLKLNEVDDLKFSRWKTSQLQALLFQSLENLEVKSCANLLNLSSASASFRNLTTLIVYGCNQLMNLLTSPVAKSMVQLEMLNIESCSMLVEIVEDDNDGTIDEIAFTKMKTLELIDLQSLKSFSSGLYGFKFPCLEQVTLHECPNVRIFCLSIVSTPMLDHVKYNPHSEECCWEGDLNATIEKLYKNMVGFKVYPTHLNLSVFPKLKENWGDQFTSEYCVNLKRLIVADCEHLSNVIASHQLQYLERLKVLIVEKCASVEQVFDLEALNDHEYRIKQMKNLNELQLIDLPRLTHVWSTDPQQILSLKNLRVVKVHNCGNLAYIFDLSIALSLQNLQHVEVINCNLVEHIIAKAEETMQENRTIFPSLHSINLLYLPNLLSFYSTSGFLECPSLKFIEVIECPNMELFPATFSKEQDSSTIVEEMKEWISSEDPDSMAAFMGNTIAIPRLEELKVEWTILMEKLNENNYSGFVSKLKHLKLTRFLGEYAILPSSFLQHFPKLEKLTLYDALVEEVNFYEWSILNDKHPKSLVLLTKLKLSKLPKLKHLVHDESQLVPLFQNLGELELLECSRLKILVPSSVSFQNLTNLQLSKCDGLIYLISASTARSLVQLRRMSVKDCQMMQEIVAIGLDGEEYEIRFSRLNYLKLDGLPTLTGFCSGNYGFHFPSLEEVMVRGCPNMKNFSEQAPITPKLGKVKTGRREYEWEWEGSLNNTIQALFMDKDYEETNTSNMCRGATE